jgi:hypothetical protein
LHLKLLADSFAVLKLPQPQTFPAWLAGVTPFFVAQTEDEFSVMCPQQHIPAAVGASRDWRCLRADGDLAFDEVGVVARLSKPLADAGLSLFLVSTHDRDYVFVHGDHLDTALTIYRDGGFTVET